jgi:hypothetical protein
MITYSHNFFFILFKSGKGQLQIILTQALTHQDSETGVVPSKSKELSIYLIFNVSMAFRT